MVSVFLSWMGRGPAIGLLAYLLVAGPAVQGAPTIAYRGATLIDGSGAAPIRDAVVLAREGRIVAAGPVAVARGFAIDTTVDVSGKWIVPGLIDTHVHFFESGRPTMDAGLRSQDPSLREADDVRWVKERLPFTLERYLCAGVTTALSVGGPAHIEYGARDLARQHPERAPRVLVAGGPVANSGLEWIYDRVRATYAADTEAEMRHLVRRFHGEGADAVKLGYLGPEIGLSEAPPPEAYAPVLAAAADEAQGLGMPVITHVMTRAAFDAILGTGLDAYAHLPFDAPLDAAAVARVREAGAAVAATIALFPRELAVLEETLELLPIERACADPEVLASYRVGSEARRDAFRKTAWGLRAAYGDAAATVGESARLLDEAGVPLLIGSDASHLGTLHGVALHVELMLLEKAGVRPHSLLLAATRNAARVLGREDLGILEPGARADFLVLDGNPLDSVANLQRIARVVKDGQDIDRSGLLVH